jgi:hypothetical protein
VRQKMALGHLVPSPETPRGRHGDVGRGLHGAFPPTEARGTAERCGRACLELETVEEVLEEPCLNDLVLELRFCMALLMFGLSRTQDVTACGN